MPGSSPSKLVWLSPETLRLYPRSSDRGLADVGASHTEALASKTDGLRPDPATAVEHRGGVRARIADHPGQCGTLPADRLVPAVAVDQVVVSCETVVEAECVRHRVGLSGNVAGRRERAR